MFEVIVVWKLHFLTSSQKNWPWGSLVLGLLSEKAEASSAGEVRPPTPHAPLPPAPEGNRVKAGTEKLLTWALVSHHTHTHTLTLTHTLSQALERPVPADRSTQSDHSQRPALWNLRKPARVARRGVCRAPGSVLSWGEESAGQGGADLTTSSRRGYGFPFPGGPSVGEGLGGTLSTQMRACACWGCSAVLREVVPGAPTELALSSSSSHRIRHKSPFFCFRAFARERQRRKNVQIAEKLHHC